MVPYKITSVVMSASYSLATYAGTDNVFMSFGVIEDNQTGFSYTDFDTAVAGTIIHEMGHSLCLTDTQSYLFQSNSCALSGVDASSSLSYDGVMNHNLQMFETKYSDGENGSGNHDVWSAVDEQGISDFSKCYDESFDPNPGLTIEQAQRLKKVGEREPHFASSGCCLRRLCRTPRGRDLNHPFACSHSTPLHSTRIRLHDI